MAYHAMGSISPSDYNATKYPGTCKPTNFAALDKFRTLQAQLNRVAQAVGLSKIPVDGDIGPKTLALIRAIRSKGLPTGADPAAIMFLTGDASTCVSVAASAEIFAAGAKAVADARSVPSVVAQPTPVAPVTIVTPQGTEVAAPASVQQNWSPAIGSGSGMPMSPLLLLVGGGLLYYVVTERKGKKGSRMSVTFSQTRRATRVARRRRSRSRRSRR